MRSRSADYLRRHAERERARRRTPACRALERLRSKRRYAEIRLNPAKLEKLRARRRAAAARRRRRLGVPVRVTSREQIRVKRRAKEARYWARSWKRRLSMNLRARIRAALKGTKKAGDTVELLGCSLADFKMHLERLFQPGMTWGNRALWHLDHKVPCARFDLRDPAQQRACFHFTNIQPLWDNLKKGAQ